MNSAEVLIKFNGDTKDLDKSVKDAEKSTSGLGNKIAGAFKVATAGILAASAAIGKITVESVKAYADYEQLEGGIETLFGTGGMSAEEYANKVGKSLEDVQEEWNNLDTAQKDVMNNAENAYKTAGLSANEYMSTVSSFAASLKQSMKDSTPQEIAAAADKAVIDMADNANKMGTSMEMIQNAYQGFAKQNYTMLDNLKLGYGGTKTEMERLLADATKISGVKYDINNLNEVYEAIHVIQGELGITGTTAKEASTTISGSLNSMKSAWNNVLVAFGGGSDLDTAFDNLIESAMTFADNLLPVVEKALDSIVEYLPKVLDKIINLLPGLLTSLIPKAVNVLINLVKSLAKALPQIIEALVQGLILIVQALAEEAPTLIPILVDAILGIIPVLIDNAPLFVKAGMELLTGLAVGIIKSIPVLLTKAKEIGVSLLNYFKSLPKLWKDVGTNMIQGLWNGIKDTAGWLMNKIKSFVGNVTNFIKKMFKIGSPSKLMASEVGQWLPKGIAVGIDANTDSVTNAMKDLQQNVLTDYGLSPEVTNSSALNYSPNVVVNVQNNMDIDPLGQVVNKIKTFSGGAKNDYNWGAGI